MTKATNYAAFAKGSNGGWTAHYGAPGDEIKSISENDGDDLVYASAEEAESAAAVRLVEVLNTRLGRIRQRGKVSVDRITGPELAELLQDAGLTPAAFSQAVGMRGDHLEEMLTGKNGRKVSPQVELLATLFAESVDALEIARS